MGVFANVIFTPSLGAFELASYMGGRIDFEPTWQPFKFPRIFRCKFSVFRCALHAIYETITGIKKKRF